MPIPITLDLSLQLGEFHLRIDERFEATAVALFGPSGAGKTTILDTIAGFRCPDRGEIRIGDRVLYSSADAVNLPSRERLIGYVPQEAAVFPHLKVRSNILYGASRGRPVPMDLVAEMLEIGPLLDRQVGRLSGGERQRVALARAIMSSPDLLLLDEPLASLDVPLRKRIIPYLQRIRDALGVPILYVSHDEDEVRAVADWVIVVGRGRVVASGPAMSKISSPGGVSV